MDLINELWGFVNVRKNFFLPTKKANGWKSTKAARNTRTYDPPRTPYLQCLDSGILSDQATKALQQLHDETNPADLTRNINRIQQALIASAKDKTLALRHHVALTSSGD